jgi:ribosomal protein S18 acetylase RimI-like enzyme
LGDEIGIRPMRGVESERVLELWVDLVEHHRRLDSEYPASRGLLAALRRELVRVLREPQCRLFVAEGEGELCGFLLAEMEDPDRVKDAIPGGCWIHEIYVAPRWRRRGLGSRLVEQARAFFSDSQGSRISVRVEARNAEGLRFWERCGFGERARILESSVHD